MKNEVPDNYIERNDYVNEPGPPNREDACMVCDKIDCECIEEEYSCPTCGKFDDCICPETD